MWDLDDSPFSPETFSGEARLFPLPNLVMFPNVMQPLHVFEPRYREMVEDALAGDHLIAMSLLEPGWESDYEGRPPIAPVACLGKIASHCRLEQGRYNIMLLGVRRVRVVRELASTRSFRRAQVELQGDLCTAGDGDQQRLQSELLGAFKRLLPQMPAAAEQLDDLLAQRVPLGMLTDIVAYTLDLELCFKQQLLTELNVERRAELLLERLAAFAVPCAATRAAGDFPPRFSSN